jgi:cardiolipin synthase
VSVLTAANQLTFLRLLLVPVFALCMLYEWPGWALVTLLVAGLTDALDGLIARRTGHTSAFGAWLDPMADKLLLVTMFVMLTLPGLRFTNHIPVWLTVLVISRDVAIVLTVAIVNLAVGRRTFMPSLLGKAATGIFIATGVCALYENYRGVESRILPWFVYVCLVVTVASAIHYAARMVSWLSSGTGGSGPEGPAALR